MSSSQTRKKKIHTSIDVKFSAHSQRNTTQPITTADSRNEGPSFKSKYTIVPGFRGANRTLGALHALYQAPNIPSYTSPPRSVRASPPQTPTLTSYHLGACSGRASSNHSNTQLYESNHSDTHLYESHLPVCPILSLFLCRKAVA